MTPNKKPISPLVSIIVPVFNGEKYLELCLQSVLNQTYPHFELIIINDGSTDGTHDIVTAFLKKNPGQNILYSVQENLGLCKTLNKGLRMAQGDYVCCLGADDLHLENFLKDAVGALLKAPLEVCSVYTDGYVIDAEGRKLCRWSDRAPAPWGKNQYKELLVTNWLPVAGLLHRRAVLLEQGPVDEDSPNEDYHMWLRLSEKYRFRLLPKIGFLYRIHGKNQSVNDEHVARTALFITRKNEDMRRYLNFVWALLQRDLKTVFKLFSFFNLDLLRRTFLRRCQIIIRGRTPVTISLRRQKKVLQIVAENYPERIWASVCKEEK